MHADRNRGDDGHGGWIGDKRRRGARDLSSQVPDTAQGDSQSKY